MTIVHISDEVVHLAGVGIVHSPTETRKKIKGYYLRILLPTHRDWHAGKNPVL